MASLGALLELEPDADFEGHGRCDVAAVLTELQARLKRPSAPLAPPHGVPSSGQLAG